MHTNRRGAASRTRPKTVRVFHFADWIFDDTGPWAVRSFVNKYIAGMLHMKNIRELKFTASFVDAEHRNSIATLGSLEELSFIRCTFLQGPGDVELEKRVRALTCSHSLLSQNSTSPSGPWIRDCKCTSLSRH